MRAATNTPAEPQDAFLTSSPATTAFPVVVAGRLLRQRFQGLLGVHCALRPAWPADSLEEPFLGVLQPICHLLIRPKYFRLGRARPVGISTGGFNVPCKAHTTRTITPTNQLVSNGDLIRVCCFHRTVDECFVLVN